MSRVLLTLAVLGGLAWLGWNQFVQNSSPPPVRPGAPATSPPASSPLPFFTHPLMISEMRKREYPGSEIRIERTLARQLREAKQPYEFYVYKGNDHNLSQSFGLAMRRSVAFFDRYLKAD